MTRPALRRIAMWSGPRNISTAMMRSFGHRGDCHVSDEPLYAAYLAATGLDHPAREAVIAAGDTDAARVARHLTQDTPPGGATVWYQKHMSHHLLPGQDTAWVERLSNVFLIRDPARVVASYVKSRAQVEPLDIGLLQQQALFEREAQRLGRAPLVLDAEDFLRDPAAHLQALCAALQLDYTPRMLHWPPGPRDTDGVWAPHWYAAVWRSTGFERRQADPPALQGHEAEVAEACREAYLRLWAHRLRPASPAP